MKFRSYYDSQDTYMFHLMRQYRKLEIICCISYILLFTALVPILVALCVRWCADYNQLTTEYSELVQTAMDIAAPWLIKRKNYGLLSTKLDTQKWWKLKKKKLILRIYIYVCVYNVFVLSFYAKFYRSESDNFACV